MRIFVDIDGTLTTEQRGNSAFKSPLRQDVIDKVKSLIKDGHEIILWTGNTEYAKRVAEYLGIDAIAAVGKPQLIIDNENVRWSRRLQKAMVTPETFLEMKIDPPEAKLTQLNGWHRHGRSPSLMVS